MHLDWHVSPLSVNVRLIKQASGAGMGGEPFKRTCPVVGNGAGPRGVATMSISTVLLFSQFAFLPSKLTAH